MLALKHHVLDAWFSGQGLRAANKRIQVKNIAAEMSGRATYTAAQGADGRSRRKMTRDTLKITITFTVYEWEDVYAREAAIEAANAWARDGWLEISTKLDRRVRVVCTGRAAPKKPRDHNEEFTLTFESSGAPFWEDKTPRTYNLAGTAKTENVSVPGTRTTAPANVAIMPTGGTLQTLTLTFGDTAMRFAGLGVPVGTALILDHDENGYLRIMAGSVSKYARRTADSDDELTCLPGVQAAGFTANVSCGVAFSVRGRYE